MTSHSPLFTPQVGAQFDPVTGEHRANMAEERFIDRGGRWWMRQARIYAEQLGTNSLPYAPQPGTRNPELGTEIVD